MRKVQLLQISLKHLSIYCTVCRTVEENFPIAIAQTKPLVQTISYINALTSLIDLASDAVLSTSYLPSARRPFIEYLSPGIILRWLELPKSLLHTWRASPWHKLQIRGIAGDEYGDYQ